MQTVLTTTAEKTQNLTYHFFKFHFDEIDPMNRFF